MKKTAIFINLVLYIWLGIFSTLIYLELLIGSSNSIDINKYWIHNIMICYLISILVFNIFRKKSVLLILSSFALVWSIISHFVLQLHGSPLCFSLFKTFKTAVTVIDNYHITIDFRVFILLLIFAANIGTVCLFPTKILNRYKETKINILYKAAFLMFFAAYSVFAYSIAYENMSWAPFFLIEQRGYCSYLITDSIYCFNHFSKPEGYDEKLVPTGLTEWDDNISDTYPDIIVILNESFSDITRYSDVKTDIDPLEELNYISNLYAGYCITPNSGGGTNTSEYELLTSNSSALLTIDAPFNYINFEKHNSSAVSYLNDLNYSTYAFHCFSKENYNRKIAYPAMGFTHVYLGEDNFEYHHRNGNRDWLDEDNYKDIIRVFNESPESPKFMYLLTYQNHGGYEQNPSELDTIHSLGQYEISNEIIDEYLSSIALSAHAFKELTDYYSSITRPVVICMVGDHTFSYSETLNTISSTRIEKEIANRTVPYFVWANYPINTKAFTQYTSMTDLLPSILYASGIKLDDYYKQILSLHEKMPGKTAFGVYVDNDGTIKGIEDDPNANDAWNKYMYAEYRRLTN